jgi:hypothetical protein
MKYLEIAALTTLTDLLTACEVGDSVLNGRIEAFSCGFTTLTIHALMARLSALPHLHT